MDDHITYTMFWPRHILHILLLRWWDWGDLNQLVCLSWHCSVFLETRSRSSANAKQLLRSVLQCSSLVEVCYGIVVVCQHCRSRPGCQHLTLGAGFLRFQDELASHTMPHMNWLPDGQSSHEPPAARSLREYEEFAGISFEKRKLSVPRRIVGNQKFLSVDTSEVAISTGWKNPLADWYGGSGSGARITILFRIGTIIM